MQTSLYKITFKDGRIFKVFCANARQTERFLKLHTNLKDEILSKNTEFIANGIHTIKQFESIIKTNINK